MGEEISFCVLREKIIKTSAVLQLLADRDVQINHLQRKLDKILAKYQEKKIESDDLKKNLTDYRQYIETISKANEKLSSELITYKCDQSKLEAQFNEASFNYQKAHQKISNLEKENEKHCKQIENLTEKLAKSKKIGSHRRQSQELKRLKDEIESLKLENNLRDNGAQSSCRRESEEVKRLKEEIEILKLENNLRDNSPENERLKLIEEKEYKIEELENELTHLKAENSRLKANQYFSASTTKELETLEKLKTKHKKEVICLKQNHQITMNNVILENKALRAKIEQLQLENNLLSMESQIEEMPQENIEANVKTIKEPVNSKVLTEELEKIKSQQPLVLGNMATLRDLEALDSGYSEASSPQSDDICFQNSPVLVSSTNIVEKDAEEMKCKETMEECIVEKNVESTKEKAQMECTDNRVDKLKETKEDKHKQSFNSPPTEICYREMSIHNDSNEKSYSKLTEDKRTKENCELSEELQNKDTLENIFLEYSLPTLLSPMSSTDGNDEELSEKEGALQSSNLVLQMSLEQEAILNQESCIVNEEISIKEIDNSGLIDKHTVLKGEKAVLEKETSLFDEKSLDFQQEASISVQEASISVQEASISVQEALISGQEASISVQETSISVQGSSISVQATSISAQDNSISAQETSSQENSVLEQDTSTLDQETSIRKYDSSFENNCYLDKENQGVLNSNRQSKNKIKVLNRHVKSLTSQQFTYVQEDVHPDLLSSSEEFLISTYKEDFNVNIPSKFHQNPNKTDEEFSCEDGPVSLLTCSHSTCVSHNAHCISYSRSESPFLLGFSDNNDSLPQEYQLNGWNVTEARKVSCTYGNTGYQSIQESKTRRKTRKRRDNNVKKNYKAKLSRVWKRKSRLRNDKIEKLKELKIIKQYKDSIYKKVLKQVLKKMPDKISKSKKASKKKVENKEGELHEETRLHEEKELSAEKQLHEEKQIQKEKQLHVEQDLLVDNPLLINHKDKQKHQQVKQRKTQISSEQLRNNAEFRDLLDSDLETLYSEQEYNHVTNRLRKNKELLLNRLRQRRTIECQSSSEDNQNFNPPKRRKLEIQNVKLTIKEGPINPSSEVSEGSQDFDELKVASKIIPDVPENDGEDLLSGFTSEDVSEQKLNKSGDVKSSSCSNVARHWDVDGVESFEDEELQLLMDVENYKRSKKSKNKEVARSSYKQPIRSRYKEVAKCNSETNITKLSGHENGDNIKQACLTDKLESISSKVVDEINVKKVNSVNNNVTLIKKDGKIQLDQNSRVDLQKDSNIINMNERMQDNKIIQKIDNEIVKDPIVEQRVLRLREHRQSGGSINKINKTSQKRISRLSSVNKKMSNLSKVPQHSSADIKQNQTLPECQLTIKDILERKEAAEKFKSRIIKPVTKVEKTSFKRPNTRKTLSNQLNTPMSPEHETQFPEGLLAEPVLIPCERVQQFSQEYANSLFQRLLTYSSEESTLQKVAGEFLFQEAHYIASLILKRLFEDIHDIPDRKFTPPIPPSTETQRTLLGLMSHLETLGMDTLFNLFLQQAEEQLLCLQKIQLVDPIARMYTIVCFHKKAIYRVRKFFCDSLFFMGDLSIPCIYTILTCFPDVLPIKEDSTRIDSPLIAALVQSIFSKSCNTPGYNLKNLHTLLIEYYKYSRDEYDPRITLSNLLQQFKENCKSTVKYAILIICKCFNSKWVFSQLQCTIKPFLDECDDIAVVNNVVSLTKEILKQFDEIEDQALIDKVSKWF